MPAEAGTRFLGFPRADDSVGVRDHTVILSTVALTDRWAELIARDGDGDCVVVRGGFPRGLRKGDLEQQETCLRQLVAHPNVGAALILCHDAAAQRRFTELLDGLDRPCATVALMDMAGMASAVAHGREQLAALASQKRGERVSCDLRHLTLALECGGSDPTSALCANPVIGNFVDRVVDAGGSAIVSETIELIGTEGAIRERAASPAAAEAIIALIARREAWLRDDGVDYRSINPTPENIESGITTLVEKSMGALAKTGSRPFSGALDFAEPPAHPGLYVMDTPFFSPISITGMVAAGANLALFALGVFNPSGSPLAPTIKVCGNRRTVQTWHDCIDLDVSATITDGESLDSAADRLASTACSVASGEPSLTEGWGDGQILLPHRHELL